jgi:prepilin-type processing-associated H-X9-DG protein
MYANANGGAFPDTIDKLITTQDMVAENFVCPHAPDTPAPGATARAQAANLSKGGHLSYVYVGKGMSTAQPPPDLAAKTVLAYEPLTNHGNGIYALFADGHVEFVDAGPARQLIADVEAGKNPPGGKASPGY